MSAIDIELATLRGFASCRGDDARIDEAEAELAALRGEMERLRAENKALRDDLARISEEMGLPPTVGPAPGVLKRFMAMALSRTETSMSSKTTTDSAIELGAGLDTNALNAAAAKLRKLRLTDVGGRKEHPSETVKSALKRGLGGLYDDEAITYILRHGIRYYQRALASDP